jgi:hypothetical protein
MGKWMQQFGIAAPLGFPAVTDKTAREIAESSASVMSVPNMGISGNLAEEENIQKVTLSTTDNTDIQNDFRFLSVTSVPQIENLESILGKRNLSDTPTPSTDKADSDRKSILAGFCDLVRHIGADRGKLLDDVEILRELDVDGIRELGDISSEMRLAWATALAQRLIRQNGLVPAGWNKEALCASCGPVWSFTTIECLACPWCELRTAGKRFPRPKKCSF